MAIMNAQNGQMFLPPEDETKPNERELFHPETNIDQVLVNGDGETLRDLLGPQTVVSDTNPGKPGVWFQITARRNVDSNGQVG